MSNSRFPGWTTGWEVMYLSNTENAGRRSSVVSVRIPVQRELAKKQWQCVLQGPELDERTQSV
jgi:hypothetical protein